MSTCNGCLKLISTDKFLTCHICSGRFHNKCLNLKDDQFLALSLKCRASWMCPSCTNVTRRKKNINTPVWQHQLPVVDTDPMNMNMSFDSQDCGPSTASNSNSNSTVPSKAPVPCDYQGVVTMEKMSALFDQKLNASLSVFMKDFRSALKEDVKALVRSEMCAVVKEFKDDLNSATDFLSSEQESLKLRVAEKDATIKILEADAERLHGDVRNLTSRISTIEKTTRGHNVEIQAVPENRNENVSLLFKKLCEIVNCPIEDNSIHACRRVAKMDSDSKRPRNILVTLASPRLKDSVLSAVQRYNKGHPRDPLSSRHVGISSESHKIYVVEHLSPECKQLHAAARKFARDKQYKYVWVKYGRVYLRKDDNSGSIYIKNHDSLVKL